MTGFKVAWAMVKYNDRLDLPRIPKSEPESDECSYDQIVDSFVAYALETSTVRWGPTVLDSSLILVVVSCHARIAELCRGAAFS